MKYYISLIKKTYNRNYELYNFRNEAILIYLFFLVSYVITPIFLILKIKPNNITAVNFLLAVSSLLLILSAQNRYLVYGLFIYFIFRVLDFCDGNVARMTKQSSFYGRFLDSTLDIFYESFLILSIGFYCFKYHNSEKLFFLGILS